MAAVWVFLAAFPLVFLVSRGGVPWLTILKIGAVLGVIHYSLLYIGLHIGMPPGLSSLVMQVQVIFTVVLSVLVLKDQPLPVQIFGMCVSMFGIGLLIVDRYQTTSFIALMVIIAAGAALSFSNFMIKVSKITNMFNFMVWMSLIPPVPLLMLSFVFEAGQLEAVRNITWTGVGAMLYASYFGTILATVILGWLLRRYSANIVSPFFLLVPVFGMVSSYLIIGETLTSVEALSSVLVLLGLLFTIFHARIAGWLMLFMGRFKRSV